MINRITIPRTFMVATLSAPLIVGCMWSVSTVECLLQTINSFVFDAFSFKLLLSAHREILSNSSCAVVMNQEATIKYNAHNLCALYLMDASRFIIGFWCNDEIRRLQLM